MPQDIGPQLRYARPRSHVGFVSASGMRTSTRQDRARTTSSHGNRNRTQATPDTEYQIELLEYEWPDLPPIIDMKDAVTRKRVSRGIHYLLPVDKGKNSIDSKFRTDLRAMFQEPYATEGLGYDDSRVVKSAKLHFQTNVVDTKWTQRHIRDIPVRLNSESERSRRFYAHSAPAGGRTKSGNPDKLKTRSSLFLPIKATHHPEANKLRKEAEKIIKSVREDNDDYDEDQEAEMTSQAFDEGTSKPEKRKSVVKFFEGHADGIDIEDDDKKTLHKKLTAAEFDSYDQLKMAKPPKPTIPEKFKSEYLSVERNQEIWDWLHYGETITDFEYFLSVCG